MPLLSIIRPEIPAESKDKFLDAWPTLVADLRAQPGVVHAGGGQIVAEDGQGVEDFKFLQYIAFKTAEDEEAFATSAWAQEHKARLEARGAAQPAVGRFDFAEFSGSKEPKPFLQFSSITLSEESKRVDARSAWIDLTAALGKESNGGKLLSDDVILGLGLVGWDSVEEIESAYKEPKAAEAFAAYKSVGETKNVLVKLL